MKRRYGIILPEDVYRDWRAGAARQGQSVGDWLVDQLSKEAMVADIDKAIAQDAVKVERPGRPGKPELSKGLGEIPGDVAREPVRDSSFGAPRPAPKPGKAK